MPNHVTNKLIITGPNAAVTELIREVAGPEDNFFCLNRIIPMPLVLRDTESGTRAHWGAVALGRKELAGYIGREVGFQSSHWQEEGVTNIEKLKAYLEQKKPDWIEEGRKIIAAKDATGYKDWYEWSVAKWGTKWDTYDQCMTFTLGDEMTATFQFNTAWSPPEPVIDELAGLFPELQFEHRFFDEGHGFWGVHCYQGGECISISQNDESIMRELCLELQGYDPDVSDEEEE